MIPYYTEPRAQLLGVFCLVDWFFPPSDLYKTETAPTHTVPEV